MDCGPGSTPIPTPCVTPGQCFALPESLHWMRDTNEGLGGLLWGHLWCPVPCGRGRPFPLLQCWSRKLDSLTDQGHCQWLDRCGLSAELPLAQPAGGLGSTVPRAYPEASGRDRRALSHTALQDSRHGWGALCVLCSVLPSTQGTAVLIPVMDIETGV